MKEFGSYSQEDVIFLLKDISDIMIEKKLSERENAIQNGVHYSEMLPVEDKMSNEYLNLFRSQLDNNKKILAYAVGVMSEKIIRKKGKKTILVSLARAGIPIGILAKRYIKYRYGINIPHYSISIIRDKGIDENAISYILNHHKEGMIQFIDGWTGKGTIARTLEQSCRDYYNKYNIELDNSLAVLTDCAGYSDLYGSREDFLIPSACLNSTVSGLISRTVLRKDIIGESDFHGAKYYKELKDEDLSNEYVDIITAEFSKVISDIEVKMRGWSGDTITKIGEKDVGSIRKDLLIDNINFIKPGIGETTRVLLRRVPDKILVTNFNDKELEHILILAKEKKVEVEEYPLMAYKCCGIIKNMRDV